MAKVLVFLPDRVTWSRLRTALDFDRAEGRVHKVVACARLEGFLAEVDAHAWDLLIVDPLAVDGTMPGGLARLETRVPMVPLVLYGNFSSCPATGLLELAGRAPSSTWLTLGVDDQPLQVLRCFRAALAGNQVERSYRGLLREFDGLARRHLKKALEATDTGRARLARHFHRSPRTLRRHFRRAGLAPPSAVTTLCRLVHAAKRIERGDCTVETTARALGFGTAENLRHHFARAVAVRPTEVRRSGGYDAFIARVSKRLRRR